MATLADKQVALISVLAVQEPFCNSFIPTTHNPSYSNFHLHHLSVPNFWVCFFINKSIKHSSLSEDFPSPDYSFVCLRSPVNGAGDVVIHNIYRPTGFKSAIASLSDSFPVPSDVTDVLSLLSFLLQDTYAAPIVLGDFNLYHTTRGGPHVRPDSAFKHLKSLYNAHFLQLLIAPGTVTWEQSIHKSIIYLSFAIPPRKIALESCKVRKDLY